MFPLIIYFSHLTKKSAIQNSGKQSFNIISSFVKKKKKQSNDLYFIAARMLYDHEKNNAFENIFTSK